MTEQVLGTWVENASFLGAAAVLVAFLGAHLLFTLLLLRQTVLLNSLLKTRSEFFIQVLSFAHFLFGLVVFVIALVYFPWKKF